MVNDQKKTNFPRTPLLDMLYSEKQAISRPTLPREFKTSDFAACYRHSSLAPCGPTYSVTSHHSRALHPLPPLQLLHTYPCSAVTWNPYVQTSSLEDGCDWNDTRCVPPGFRYQLPYKRYDNDSDRPLSSCRCVKCTDSRCPGNYYSGFKPPANRTTIMTFRDQCTMTMRLNEAATAVTPVPSDHGSDSDADCNYAVRENPRTFTPDRGKPILKNRTDCCKKYAEYVPPLLRDPPPPRPAVSLPYYHYPPEPCSPERDKDTEEEQVIQPSRLSSFFKFMKKKDPPNIYCPNRRPLYNEGISDIKAENVSYFDRPEIIPSVTNATKLRSKVSIKSKCYNESRSKIPYAHHNDSKFHRDCANSRGSDVLTPRRVVASSRINKTPMSPNLQTIPPPAKNPRKLLTSERALDEYAEGRAYSYAEARTQTSNLKRTHPKRI